MAEPRTEWTLDVCTVATCRRTMVEQPSCELAGCPRRLNPGSYSEKRLVVDAALIGDPLLRPRPGKTIRDEMEELTDELNRAENRLVAIDGFVPDSDEFALVPVRDLHAIGERAIRQRRCEHALRELLVATERLAATQRALLERRWWHRWWRP